MKSYVAVAHQAVRREGAGGDRARHSARADPASRSSDRWRNCTACCRQRFPTRIWGWLWSRKRPRCGGRLMRSRLSAAGKVSLLALLLAVAAAAGSWALLAEISRMGFGHAWSGWDRWAHRRADQSAIYEYGGAKLAHAGGIAIAAKMAVALWIAARCVEQMLRGGTVSDQRGFAVAASIAALVGAIAAIRSNRSGQSRRQQVQAADPSRPRPDRADRGGAHPGRCHRARRST